MRRCETKKVSFFSFLNFQLSDELSGSVTFEKHFENKGALSEDEAG